MSDKNHEISDKDIIIKVLNGNYEAYNSLLVKYRKRIFSLVFRYLDNEDETNDVVQVTFIKAFRKLSSFDLDKEFFPWLYKIAINSALNALKRRNRKLKHFIRIEKGKDAPQRNGDPLNQFIYKETEHQVQEAINGLEPKFREVFILVVQEGFSYEEAAQILGIPPGTVMSRLNRARQKLKKMLKDYLE